ncbi:MAG: sulfatase-like hydrolase/transferase [Kiritimatiellae bacterium]|jgi:arylsulfatase A-like enzyme|nr:sulfatase-like hydrolase/transferase [Kiritimatiellia bacterium]
MNNLRMVISVGCVAAAICCFAKQPNILMIYVDDMGYSDPGCYGGKMVPTPNIDSLAEQGVRFTDGYVTSSVCAPSRCGLLSGAYNQRFGMQWNQDQYQQKHYNFSEGHLLMPEALAAGGYVTGHAGKWNVAADAKKVFDESYHEMDWKGHYFRDEGGGFMGVDGYKVKESNGDEKHDWGPKDMSTEYLTDLLTDDALSFIKRHGNGTKPFFFYLAYNAVHTPLQARKTDKFDYLPNEPLRIYAAMVESLDYNIGRVLKVLKDSGLDENTLIAFASDNGPAKGNPHIKGWHKDWPAEVILGSAAPLGGHKAQYFDGGIRVPYIIKWPGVLKGGSIYTQPVSTMDLYPTFCAAAGISVPAKAKLDGVNLLPFIKGSQKGTPHETLLWMHDELGAVRRGKWKLVISKWQPKLALFNLETDIGEKENLAEQNPEMTQTLHRAWKEWCAQMPPRANPPPKIVNGWLSGKFIEKKLTPPKGKPFSAWALADDQGHEHIIYHRLLKDKMNYAEMKALVNKRVKVKGKRQEAPGRNMFERVDEIEAVNK